VDILPALIVLGIGAGRALPAVTTTTVSEATPADAGLVSGPATTSQQVGGALGTAVPAARWHCWPRAHRRSRPSSSATTGVRDRRSGRGGVGGGDADRAADPAAARCVLIGR